MTHCVDSVYNGLKSHAKAISTSMVTHEHKRSMNIADSWSMAGCILTSMQPRASSETSGLWPSDGMLLG